MEFISVIWKKFLPYNLLCNNDVSKKMGYKKFQYLHYIVILENTEKSGLFLGYEILWVLVELGYNVYHLVISFW